MTRYRTRTSPNVPHRVAAGAGICVALLSAMRRLAAIVLLLALAACGDQYEQQLKSARSWSATALMVARAWDEGEVPSAFAERALEKAADELGKGPLPEAADAVDELIDAVARGDHPAVKRLVAELAGK